MQSIANGNFVFLYGVLICHACIARLSLYNKSVRKKKPLIPRLLVCFIIFLSFPLLADNRHIASEVLEEGELQIVVNGHLYVREISRVFYIPSVFRYGLAPKIEMEIEFPWVVADYYTTVQQGTLGDIHLIPKVEIFSFFTVMVNFNLATGSRNTVFYPFSYGDLSFSLGGMFHHRLGPLIFMANGMFTFQGKVGELFFPLKLNLLDGKTYLSVFGLYDFFFEFERYENDYFSGDLGIEWIFDFIPLKPSIFSFLYLRHEDLDPVSQIIKVNSEFGLRINGIPQLSLMFSYLFPWREETRQFYQDGYLLKIVLYL